LKGWKVERFEGCRGPRFERSEITRKVEEKEGGFWFLVSRFRLKKKRFQHLLCPESSLPKSFGLLIAH
jgi:hypothetical protein